MSRFLVPWPVEKMRRMYEGGQTLEEVASLLASDAFQPFWLVKLGREYRPTSKMVNKVAKRHNFAMRKRGYRTGEKHHLWSGGRTTDKAGYILLYSPDHPNANSAGYVREHRLVVEKILGRFLLPTEVVHHIDDDPTNNSPENLMVFENNGQHLAHTLRGKKHNISPEGRAAMLANNQARKGRKYDISPERRAEKSAAQKARFLALPEDSKRRIREASQRNNEKRRLAAMEKAHQPGETRSVSEPDDPESK